MKATFRIEGKPLEAQFTDCILHTSGEYAGNLDFSIKFSGPVPPKAILRNLRLKFPGKERLIEVAGYEETNDGFNITMYSTKYPHEERNLDSAVPASVDVFWLEQSRDIPIGTLRVHARPGAVGGSKESSYNYNDSAVQGNRWLSIWLSINRFFGHYTEFSKDGREFRIAERKWVIGVLFLLLLSPGFILTEGDKRLIAFIFALPGIWCIGFYRKGHFDKNSNSFEYEKGLFLPIKRVRGSLGLIRFVELHTFASGVRRRRRYSSELFLQLGSGKVVLSYGITIPYTDNARRLAVLIGCPVKFTGINSYLGLGSKGLYEESPEEALRKLEEIQKK